MHAESPTFRPPMNMRLVGTIDVAAEFYIVYSTSNVAYQDWQSEFLEYTIQSSPDVTRCQIIRLVSHDTRAEDNSYQMGSGVTFIFPSHTDRLPDGTYYAPLNKPCVLRSLAAWWMGNAKLDPDAVFVLADPDMTWHAPLEPTDIPTCGSIYGHLWTADGHVMYPLVMRASDLHLMSAAYLRHTIAEYERYDYHAEMFGFMKAAQECGLRERVDPSFGPTAGHGNFEQYTAARFLHYCQDFRVRDQSRWYKQSYTPMTLQHPWERPPLSQVVEDEGQRDVLDRLHDLITYQTHTGVRPRRIAVDADGSLLDVHLWAIADDEAWLRENCRWSLETARKCGLRPQLAGVGYDTRHLAHCKHAVDLSRLYVLRQLLSRVSDTRLLLVMDGFDTLFRGTEEQIVSTFLRCDTQILISAEKAYTYQWMDLRHKYDATPSPYRYVACGTIMGFAGALRQMTEEIIYNVENGFDHGNHQGLTGKYVHDHFDDTAHVRLDTQCQLFWVTSDDTQVFSESPFHNPYTQTSPLILHVIGGNRENAGLYRQVGERIAAASTGGPCSDVHEDCDDILARSAKSGPP
jgi:hypothetical protein